MLGYSIPTKTAAPGYTMGISATTGGFAEDLAKAPGPGKYNNVESNVYDTKAPSYSMLGRGQQSSSKLMCCLFVCLFACLLAYLLACFCLLFLTTKHL